MISEKRRRLSLILSLTGLTCPVVLFVIVLLMRSHVITFHDDFSGYKGLGFFLMWALVLLPTGLLSSSIALCYNRRSILAASATLLNLGLFSYGVILRF